MNTTPEIIRKTNAPFAAKVAFKQTSLYQGKHHNWTFPSTFVSNQNHTAHNHYMNLERFVMQDLKDSFVCAAIFDNRYTTYLEDGTRRNNLVLQISYNTIWVDNRAELDLRFLTPVFSRDFVDRMRESFEEQNYKVMHCNMLQIALQQYKETFNL